MDEMRSSTFRSKSGVELATALWRDIHRNFLRIFIAKRGRLGADGPLPHVLFSGVSEYRPPAHSLVPWDLQLERILVCAIRPVHRLAYNGDVVAFKMGRRQGARREHI